MATNNIVNLKNSGIATYDGAGTFTALAKPLTVANGGTSDSTLTAYAVVCGGTTTSNPWQSIASVGTAGQALTSNGAGALPSFQNAAATSKGYAIVVQSLASSMASTTTYYMNTMTTLTTTSSVHTRYYIPKAGTIKSAYGTMTGTTGGAQHVTVSIRLNGTSDTTITSTLDLSSSPATFNSTSLNIAVAEGDYIEFKIVTPTFSPSPTNTVSSITCAVR